MCVVNFERAPRYKERVCARSGIRKTMRGAQQLLSFRHVGLLLLLATACSAATNTTTPAPTATPAPDAGVQNVVLSFRIDGVAYVARCNVSGTVLNMSACALDVDHELTVSRIGTGTTQEIPAYYLAMVILTLIMTVILIGLAAAGYVMMTRLQKGYEEVVQDVRRNRDQPGYGAPGGGGGGYDQQPQDPQYYAGNASRLGRSRKTISVDLVKPCLPGDILAAA